MRPPLLILISKCSVNCPVTTGVREEVGSAVIKWRTKQMYLGNELSVKTNHIAKENREGFISMLTLLSHDLRCSSPEKQSW